ncbi:MAG: hypothetical protein V2A74_14180, partial [bacterium]
TSTDAGGQYQFNDVPCESRTLTATKANFRDYSETYAPTCDRANVKDFLITPVGYCLYTLLPGQVTFSGVGGTGSFSVTTYTDCNWTPVSQVPWILVLSGQGPGNGTVTYEVLPYDTPSNPSNPAPRVGAIALGPGNFTITQNYTGKTKNLPLQEYGLGKGINAVAYASNARLMATAGRRGAYLWNVETGEIVRRLLGHRADVESVVFSKDGSRVATASLDETAKLWDTDTGRELMTFTGHSDGLQSVDISPDEAKVATGSSDGTARIWDAATGNLLRTLNHTSAVYAVAFSPDGTKLLTGSSDGKARTWNVATGSQILEFAGHTSRINAAAWSPDGSMFVTGSDDETAILWNADGTPPITPAANVATHGAVGPIVLTFTGHTAPIESVAISSDGTKILTGASIDLSDIDNTAKLWNAQTGALIRTFSGHTDRLESVAFSPDASRILTGSFDQTAHLWNAATGSVVRVYDRHTLEAYSVDVSPDLSMVATGTRNNTVRLWNAATGDEIARLQDGNSSFAWDISALAFFSDGQRLVTGSADSRVRVWNLNTRQIVQRFQPHTQAINDLDLSPDETKVLTASEDKYVRLTDIITSQVLLGLIYDAPVDIAGFLPDGKRIFAAQRSIGTAYILRIDPLPPVGVAQLQHGTNPLGAVAVSPDGHRIVTCSRDGSVALWNGDTFNYIRDLSGHGAGVISAAFSPDGKLLLTGDENQLAILWDVESGQPLRTFQNHTPGTEFFTSARDHFGVRGVAFSQNGSRAFTCSTDGAGLSWEVADPRAIIVAGGGNFTGNVIAQQTDDLGAYAYRLLRSRGYESGDIQYLSAFGNRDADGDGLNDVDTSASLHNLQAAITGTFGQQAGRLLILMIDHGYKRSNFMTFRVNPSEVLPTTTLDSWLDELQTNYPVEVALVVDSCYSGQFVQDTAQAPAGRKRIVMASTSPDFEALFVPPPDLTSFTNIFLASAYMGNSLGEAWRAGLRFFQSFPIANQAPLISDGSSSTTVADREFFGATWAYGVQSTQDINRFFPAFESWTPDTTVLPGASVPLSVRLLPGENPTEVVAAIRPPAPRVISGDPVTSLAQIPLQQNLADPRIWEATMDGAFLDTGNYKVSFTARFDSQRLSNPAFTSITVSGGVDPDATPIRAVLAVGQASTSELSSAFAGLGSYAYKVYLDRFQDNQGLLHPDWVVYLTASADANRDGTPSAAAVISAISSQPSEVGRLYVHLIAESAQNVSLKLSPTENLSASALDSALDAFQSGAPNRTVVLLIDAPNAGSFIPLVTATAGQQRVVLTGSRATDDALFIAAAPFTSFTQKFLGAAYQGGTLRDGFDAGKNFLRQFLANKIQPQLDDNGDGISDFRDGALANSLFLGRRFAFAGGEASGLPFILSVTPHQAVLTGANVTYHAAVIQGLAPARVFAQLVPPG